MSTLRVAWIVLGTRLLIAQEGRYLMGVSLRDYKDPKDALKALEKRQKELVKELEELIKKRERGEISEEEFNAQKVKIEREYIEVMDRLAQLRFIVSGGF